VAQTYQTDEFGNPTLTQGTSAQPFRFAGEQRDPETSFVDLRARYYAPSLGRFLSRDLLPGIPGSPLSLDRYIYAEANPTIFSDPSGLAISRVLKLDSQCFTTFGGMLDFYAVNASCFGAELQATDNVDVSLVTAPNSLAPTFVGPFAVYGPDDTVAEIMKG